MAAIYDRRTDFQHIMLEENGESLKLYLDGYYQFDSKTEGCYHGMIAALPQVFHGQAERVLILGGGDGLALRDALRFPVLEVFLVELDPEMIEMATTFGPVRELNEDSFRDARAKTVVGDALVEVARFPDGYFDVIIADFPAATSPELEELYKPEFYDKILAKLAPGGVFVSQISEDIAFARELRNFLEVTLGHGLTIIACPKEAETQPFVFGSSKPFSVRRGLPTGSPIAGALPGISAELDAGKKVIVYTPYRKVYRGPKLA